MSQEPGHTRAGFSLVEVLVAMGLVAGVLISIAGMLVIGSRQVKSGRSSSEALAVARDIVERLESWNFRETYARFGCLDSAMDCTVLSRDGGEAAVWHERLERSLSDPGSDPGATITFNGLTADGLSASLGAAHALRVKVVVHWSEGLRQRSIELATARM